MILDKEFHGDIRVFNEARSLANSGNEVFVLCLADGKSDRITSFEDITIVRINKNQKWKNRWFFFANFLPVFNNYWKKTIVSFIIEFNIDVIYAHDLYMAKPACKAAGIKNIPFILDLHENYPAAVYGYKWAVKFPNLLFVQPWKWKAIERKYLPKADRIVVLSKNFKEQLLLKYHDLKRENIFIYGNFPDVEQLMKYKIKSNIISKGKYVFYFGGIAERRGIFTAIDAMKIIRQKGIVDLKLLLIGPVDKAEKKGFMKAINQKDIKDNIVYFSWRAISELPSLISASMLCLSPIIRNPQHDSGVANKVFQYMLFERPVIASDCVPQLEVINKSEAGLMFKSGDAYDLASKILELYNNDNLRAKMGKSGRRAVLEKFNTNVSGEKLTRMIDSLKSKKYVETV